MTKWKIQTNVVKFLGYNTCKFGYFMQPKFLTYHMKFKYILPVYKFSIGIEQYIFILWGVPQLFLWMGDAWSWVGCTSSNLCADLIERLHHIFIHGRGPSIYRMEENISSFLCHLTFNVDQSKMLGSLAWTKLGTA